MCPDGGLSRGETLRITPIMPEPILHRGSRGRPVDGWAVAIAALALALSIAGTLWFLSGFIETDPEFRAASSAFLLSVGLGGFAIIPSAVVMRLTWTAHKDGFRPALGWWTFLLMLPWIGLGGLWILRTPLPRWAGWTAVLLASLLCLWAALSLIVHYGRNRRSPDAL